MLKKDQCFQKNQTKNHLKWFITGRALSGTCSANAFDSNMVFNNITKQKGTHLKSNKSGCLIMCDYPSTALFSFKLLVCTIVHKQKLFGHGGVNYGPVADDVK